MTAFCEDDYSSDIYEYFLHDYQESLCHCIFSSYVNGYKIDAKSRRNKISISHVVDGKHVTIKMVDFTETIVDVCLLEIADYFPYANLAIVQKLASTYKKRHSSTPLILFGHDTELIQQPKEAKKVLLRGYKIMNQTKGNQLARKIGAVKYVECSEQTGRGVKILIDEIAYAGIENLMTQREIKKRCNVL